MLSKKASLEISIQAIVIVVLAMTLLGLGLGFIKGMFGKIGGITESTFGKIEEQLQRDLVNSNEKLVFSQSKVSIERGKETLLGWGIKNEGTSEMDYWVEFGPIKYPNTANNPGLNNINGGTGDWFIFKYSPNGAPNLPYSVDAADQQVERVNLRVPKNADPGLYLIEMAVYEGTGVTDKYATADIFITVT